MRRTAAVMLAVVSLAAAGCGGDDETAETVPPAPELSVPGGETPTLDDLPDSATSTTTTGDADGGADGGATPPAGDQGADQGGADQGGGQQPPSGGQPAPDDTPENDTPPPAGSPAERFEQFCEENPGAC